MKKALSIVAVLCSALAAQAQTSTNLVDQLAQQAQTRINNYEMGADVAADQAIYAANYWNDTFWDTFWVTNSQNGIWSDMRIIRIHCTNCIAHMAGSLAWLTAVTKVEGTNGHEPSVTYTDTTDSYGNITSYTVTGTLDHKTYSGTESTLSAALSDVEVPLFKYWVSENITDPNGQYYPQDTNIIYHTLVNSSAYQLATASETAAPPPDTSLLSLLLSDSQASNNVSGLETNNIDTGTDNALGSTNYSQIYQSMQACGAIIPMSAVKEPSDAVTSILAIYNNINTSPIALRSDILQYDFNSFFNNGGWNGNTYVFHSMSHGRAWNTLMNNYSTTINNLDDYFTFIDTALTAQLASANTNDESFLSNVNSYRNELTNQPPVTTVISQGQAQQIFNQQVGNQSLSSIPFINPVSYAMWLLGPPWAQTPCFPTAFGCINNPLYNTIVAQLVRGVSTDGGVTEQPQNDAMNALKANEQEQNALQDIITSVTKQTNNALLQKEQSTFYGNSSYHMSTPQVPLSTNSASLTPLYLTNSQDAMVAGVMNGVAASRAASATLATQQSNIYSKITGNGTLIERAALANEQQAAKTAVLDQLKSAINNRTTFKAMQKNAQLQTNQVIRDANTAQDNAVILQ